MAMLTVILQLQMLGFIGKTTSSVYFFCSGIINLTTLLFYHLSPGTDSNTTTVATVSASLFDLELLLDRDNSIKFFVTLVRELDLQQGKIVHLRRS